MQKLENTTSTGRWHEYERDSITACSAMYTKLITNFGELVQLKMSLETETLKSEAETISRCLIFSSRCSQD